MNYDRLIANYEFRITNDEFKIICSIAKSE